MPKYTIRQNRIKSGCIDGFRVDEDLRLILDKDSMYHGLFLRGIDGGETGMKWGRLSFDSDSSENIMFYVYALASDHKVMFGPDRTELDLDIYLSDPSAEVPDKVSMLKRLGELLISMRYWKMEFLILKSIIV
jgi:hypothetical protein